MPREELVDGRGINCKYVGNRWQIASEKPMAGSRWVWKKQQMNINILRFPFLGEWAVTSWLWRSNEYVLNGGEHSMPEKKARRCWQDCSIRVSSHVGNDLSNQSIHKPQTPLTLISPGRVMRYEGLARLYFCCLRGSYHFLLGLFEGFLSFLKAFCKGAI